MYHGRLYFAIVEGNAGWKCIALGLRAKYFIKPWCRLCSYLGVSLGACCQPVWGVWRAFTCGQCPLHDWDAPKETTQRLLAVSCFFGGAGSGLPAHGTGVHRGEEECHFEIHSQRPLYGFFKDTGLQRGTGLHQFWWDPPMELEETIAESMAAAVDINRGSLELRQSHTEVVALLMHLKVRIGHQN